MTMERIKSDPQRRCATRSLSLRPIEPLRFAQTLSLVIGHQVSSRTKQRRPPERGRYVTRVSGQAILQTKKFLNSERRSFSRGSASGETFPFSVDHDGSKAR